MSHQTATQEWRAQSLAHSKTKPILKVFPVIALVVFGTLFARHISALDGAAVWDELTGFAVWQWALAMVFTALSFMAIGTYDVIVHRVLNTDQTARAARIAGIKAIALSQTLGFGTLTSALVRWRCLHDLSAGASLRLSAVVSITFLGAMAVITALVVPMSGLVPRSTPLIASGGVAIAGLILLARLAFRLGWITLPVGGGTIVAILLATTADTALAAGALWVLWPDAVSFHLLFAAYLVALGAGLMSSAPGGVGAFDLAFLALMPVSDAACAMAALLAFRIVYYALPATVALLALMRAPAQTATGPVIHPEAGLTRQSATLHPINGAHVVTLPCWGGGAILGDLPIGVDMANLRAWSAPKALYKCSAAQAALARAAGWDVMRCAQDAIIDAQNWSTDGSTRRQLRRALKGFAASGLTLREVRDMHTLQDVATDWATTHGGEKGHSMGRFCPDYLRHQRVFAAFDDETAIAFVSFHAGPQWTLDLMRHTSDLPSGVMQALVCAALEAAKTANAHTVSLASVPAPEPHLPFAAKALADAAGLRRFKTAFGPTWVPRYLCAPSRATLITIAATLAWRIHHPAPIARPNLAHRNDEDYSFAPVPTPCDPIGSHCGALPHDQRPLGPPCHA